MIVRDNFRRSGILVNEPLTGFEMTPPSTPQNEKKYHVIGMLNTIDGGPSIVFK